VIDESSTPMSAGRARARPLSKGEPELATAPFRDGWRDDRRDF